LLLTIVPVIWLYFSGSRLEFYLIGALVGFALTGVQSVSRSMVATFAPPGQSAEFYGFFAVAGRTSSFIGPTIFGFAAAWATRRYMAEGLLEEAAKVQGHLAALVTIVVFLLAGLVLLLWVDEKKGRSTVEAD
jgi:UMF1 family MFS transporter